MPYVTESRMAEIYRIERKLDDVKPHVNAWIGLLEAHVASLPEDSSPMMEGGDGKADKSYAQHELIAMRRDLVSLCR